MQAPQLIEGRPADEWVPVRRFATMAAADLAAEALRAGNRARQTRVENVKGQTPPFIVFAWSPSPDLFDTRRHPNPHRFKCGAIKTAYHRRTHCRRIATREQPPQPVPNGPVGCLTFSRWLCDEHAGASE